MTKFSVVLLEKIDYVGFKELYEDFRIRACDDYKFELEPLSYDDFTSSVEKGLIKCLVLKEDYVPTAFLIYTTVISEAIELNIIHCKNLEQIVERSNHLIEAFLKQTQSLRKKQRICYPMLGIQRKFVSNIALFGFRFVEIAVFRLMMNNTNSQEILQSTPQKGLPSGYRLVFWNECYLNEAVNVVQEAFETSADALFDPRFKTLDGTFDILTKITKSIYAEFLPKATSVLLYNNTPVGFCFMNITDNSIVNIPIVGIAKKHQGLGLSKNLLKHSIDIILQDAKNTRRLITEINTCTETNNYSALKMYRNLGFKEDYCYTQAYLPEIKV